jgi:hypothetical protein
VLERHREEPWDNVVAADPSWVEAVMLGGDLAYGRSDWMRRVLRSQDSFPKTTPVDGLRAAPGT